MYFLAHSQCTDFQSSYLTPKELRCPGLDWYEFGEFCYKIFDDKKTWHSARSTCRGLGADLTSILSITEQSWLESYLYFGENLALLH